MPICLALLTVVANRARMSAPCIVGMASAARMAMMLMTTSSSMSVKPCERSCLNCGVFMVCVFLVLVCVRRSRNASVTGKRFVHPCYGFVTAAFAVGDLQRYETHRFFLLPFLVKNTRTNNAPPKTPDYSSAMQYRNLSPRRKSSRSTRAGEALKESSSLFTARVAFCASCFRTTVLPSRAVT